MSSPASTVSIASATATGAFATTFANVHEITYQGQWARHAPLVQGAYDFYTIQHLYTNSNSLSYPSAATLYADLLAYLAVPANLSAITDEGKFWALPCQMNYTISDLYQTDAYPSLNSGTRCAQE